ALQCGYGLFHLGGDAPTRQAGAVLADASQGHADRHRSRWSVLGPALLLTCADERRGGGGGVRGQAGALTGAAARGARVARGSQAETRGGQWTHHAPAQRLSSPRAWQTQTQGAATGQAQG